MNRADKPGTPGYRHGGGATLFRTLVLAAGISALALSLLSFGKAPHARTGAATTLAQPSQADTNGVLALAIASAMGSSREHPELDLKAQRKKMCPFTLPNGPIRCDTEAALDASLLSGYVSHLPEVEGWMNGLHAAAVRMISLLQLRQGMCLQGAVGEIGVHHGKYFFLLSAHARPSEPKIAMDLFEFQDLNYDDSGMRESSKRAKVMAHGQAIGFDMSEAGSVQLLSQDSTTLSVQQFANMGLPAFRLLSVDGGHSYETTISDMRLAACSIHEGGVFVVDDFVNPGWTGVVDAVMDFIRQHTFAAPFLWLCNKVYFTTSVYHHVYLDAVRKSPCFKCTMDVPGGHPSTYMMGNWPVCILSDANNCTVPVEGVLQSCFGL